MKTLTTKCGATVLVDDEDYPRLSQYKWRRCRGGYVRTQIWDPVVKKPVYRPLHRLVMNAQPGQYVDHRDRDKLNNTRANLRFCTIQGNSANTGKRRGTSRYRGVTWNRSVNKWQASAQVGPTKFYLGVYTDEAEAGRAYDAAALVAWGEFASLNFPTQEAR